MSPKKSKEFLFKEKGRCYKGDYKTRKRVTIYLSHTHLRFSYKNGGEVVIPLNAIIKLDICQELVLSWGGHEYIQIQTDTDETHMLFSDSIKKLYKRLSEAIASLPDGGDVHVGHKTTPVPKSVCAVCECILIIISIIFGIFGFLFLRVMGATV